MSGKLIYATNRKLLLLKKLIVSPRNIKENICEIVSRDKKISMKIPLEEITDKTKAMVEELGK